MVLGFGALRHGPPGANILLKAGMVGSRLNQSALVFGEQDEFSLERIKAVLKTMIEYNEDVQSMSFPSWTWSKVAGNLGERV